MVRCLTIVMLMSKTGLHNIDPFLPNRRTPLRHRFRSPKNKLLSYFAEMRASFLFLC